MSIVVAFAARSFQSVQGRGTNGFVLIRVAGPAWQDQFERFMFDARNKRQFIERAPKKNASQRETLCASIGPIPAHREPASHVASREF
jgi:hypothetical protein